MTDLPFPLSGSTLVLGPSQAGKTKLTASALEKWLARERDSGVIVLDFAPAVEHDGRLLGGRLDRFTTVPSGVWQGVLDAHAPRTEGLDDVESTRLARKNATNSNVILEAAPSDPRAVFVNDATIPFQHESGDPRALTEYCDGADCAVLNAFESDELGTDDTVSRREREALSVLRDWADRVVTLG